VLIRLDGPEKLYGGVGSRANSEKAGAGAAPRITGAAVAGEDLNRADR